MKFNFNKVQISDKVHQQLVNSVMNKTVNEVWTFKDLDVSAFYNKNVLLETPTKTYFGVLQSSKTGLTVIDRHEKQHDIPVFDVKSLVCEDQKITVKEHIKPGDITHWNECISEAKKTTTKGILHRACKCYEDRNGTWESETKKHIAEPVDTEHNLVIRERLKDAFFGDNKTVLLEKDIVNHEHENSMTPEEVARRNQIYRKLKRENRCKIKNNKDKTVDNACYRMATYIMLGRGSGKKSQKAAGAAWVHHHHNIGSDPRSQRHILSGGKYNQMARAFLPGMWNKNNRLQFHALHDPGIGSRRSVGARAAGQEHRRHVDAMAAYRKAVADKIGQSNPLVRDIMHRRIDKERKSRTHIAQRQPRKSRAKKR